MIWTECNPVPGISENFFVDCPVDGLAPATLIPRRASTALLRRGTLMLQARHQDDPREQPFDRHSDSIRIFSTKASWEYTVVHIISRNTKQSRPFIGGLARNISKRINHLFISNVQARLVGR